MTVITLQSFLQVSPNALIKWAERQGKEAAISESYDGFFKVVITPDLSTGQKNAVQAELDKIGRGTIT